MILSDTPDPQGLCVACHADSCLVGEWDKKTIDSNHHNYNTIDVAIAMVGLL